MQMYSLRGRLPGGGDITKGSIYLCICISESIASDTQDTGQGAFIFFFFFLILAAIIS